MTIQLGHLVKLKSAGPKMTVVDIYYSDDGPVAGKVQCQWFQYNAGDYENLQSEWFPPASLVLLPGDDQVV